MTSPAATASGALASDWMRSRGPRFEAPEQLAITRGGDIVVADRGRVLAVGARTGNRRLISSFPPARGEHAAYASDAIALAPTGVIYGAYTEQS